MRSDDGAGIVIDCRGLTKAYGTGDHAVVAVEKAEFSIKEREFVCLLGPSGCGKSTILHVIAGFIKPSDGRVTVWNRPVVGPATDRGVVFQRHTLFPWKSVAQNIAVGPRMRGVPAQEIQRIVDHYLDITGLTDFRHRYPRELSVGMQQRVGLGRAFANDPGILLMDEPFGSLDAQTRLRMQELLLSVWSEHRKTVLFVTHDIEEAILLSDRVLILSPRPARVHEDIAIDVPRPRTHDTLTQPDCVALKSRIMRSIFGS
jgi:NitT/TauT family transport system ATP-binding protein